MPGVPSGVMKVTLDRRADVLRIAFTDYDDAHVAREHSLVEHDVRGDFAFLLDKRGVMLGIEVKFASSALPPEFLDEAEPV
jgi:uncharacterized protein YuzE